MESFVLVLRGLLKGRSLDIVDFCSGTGNLLLPLAALFPQCRFHAIEMKPNAVAILLARAAAARLTNVTAEVRARLRRQPVYCWSSCVSAGTAKACTDMSESVSTQIALAGLSLAGFP